MLGTDPAPALAPPTDGPIRILVSRTRPPELATRLAELLDAELVPMGSAGAKATAVLLGAGDVYAHGGGQYEWDSAAPVGVAQAAGCHTSRLDGAPLRYNQPDPYLPDLLVCRPELAERGPRRDRAIVGLNVYGRRIRGERGSALLSSSLFATIAGRRALRALRGEKPQRRRRPCWPRR